MRSRRKDPASKKRLDDLLVQAGLAGDRREATALILSGAVLVDDRPIGKPGQPVSSGAAIRLRAVSPKYASRGGLKLEGALQHFNLQVRGKTCLDLGASTGGFTDCLLSFGAEKVYAVDVGSGLLDWRLRQDPRVQVREKVNVRFLTPDMLEGPVQLITVDLAFISLRLIFPALKLFCPVQIIALVKPQFEAEKEEVQPGGVIRDPALRESILDRVRASAEEAGLILQDEIPSPVTGQKGNLEHFLLLTC